jgi:hypothetical protein
MTIEQDEIQDVKRTSEANQKLVMGSGCFQNDRFVISLPLEIGFVEFQHLPHNERQEILMTTTRTSEPS